MIDTPLFLIAHFFHGNDVQPIAALVFPPFGGPTIFFLALRQIAPQYNYTIADIRGRVCTLPHTFAVNIAGAAGPRLGRVVFLLDQLVAGARGSFEPGAVDDDKVAAFIADKPATLQITGGLVYGFTPHAEHIRKEFLRDLKLV